MELRYFWWLLSTKSALENRLHGWGEADAEDLTAFIVIASADPEAGTEVPALLGRDETYVQKL